MFSYTVCLVLVLESFEMTWEIYLPLQFSGRDQVEMVFFFLERLVEFTRKAI